MKKTVLVLTFFVFTTLNLMSETIKADFKVEFGIFGQIGIANATLTKEENSYEIDVELKATGISKTLSGNRVERHISKGHIENGMMISDLYQVIKSYKRKTINKVYTINHETQTVTKEYKYWKNGKLKKDEHTTLEFYSKDDLLTLYFNLDEKIVNKQESKSYRFTAVGAERQSGAVEVVIPEEKELDEFHDALGKNREGWYARAIIHQDLFSSDKGELLLHIGEDGITEKAVLKDLIFFGDIRATRL